jgi:hypothetical protein
LSKNMAGDSANGIRPAGALRVVEHRDTLPMPESIRSREQ